jgi:hypothetical protein
MSGPVAIERRGLWQEERLEENLHGGRQPGPAALVRGLGGACPLGIGGRRHKIWRDIFGDGGDAGGIGHGVDDLDDNNCPRPSCLGVLLGCPVCEVSNAKGSARRAGRAGARHRRDQSHFGNQT